MCNISLKKTLVSALNYIELVVAAIMQGPVYLNPGVVLGSVIWNGLSLSEAAIYLLMEFLAAGIAVLLCMFFFWDSFKASKDAPKRGIFSAYPMEKNIPLNFVQEVLATFAFLFLVFMGITGGI